MSQEDLIIKGTRDGLLVVFPEGKEFEVLRRALAQRLSEGRGFFEGGSVTIDVGRRLLTSRELLELDRLVSQEHEMDVLRIVNSGELGDAEADPAEDAAGGPPPPFGAQPVSLWRESPSTSPLAAAGEPEGPAPVRSGWRALAAARGYQLPRAPAGGTPPAGRKSEDRALIIKGPVRSGQSVRFRGSVVIVGDVNPGAEVVAQGDIIVLGRLRGVVHAGAMGAAGAVVAAFRLEPTQLRIGEVITRPPEGDAQVHGRLPEVARVEDGAVVIDTYLALAAPERRDTASH